MKIAAAQINCTVGEVQENLDAHYRMIESAIAESAELISFPEMSITGYCMKEARDLAFIKDDPRLDYLKNLSTKGNIIIVAGAPILIEDNLYIGAFVIYPNQPLAIYTKQYLHGDENLFFSLSMDYNPIIQLGEERISLAICADINNENHPLEAKKKGSTIYMPCIFFCNKDIGRGHKQLSNYAKKNSLTILMANYAGEHWGMEAGGRSAFWDEGGDLIDQLDFDREGLLIMEKEGGR